MGSDSARIAKLEGQIKQLIDVSAAIQGQPASALISIPHNDSWLFEDNLDATHPGNLRYIISANVQRVVSARLSIHLAPYRTYNSLALTVTGNASVTHNHASTGHFHSGTFVANPSTSFPVYQDAGTNLSAPGVTGTMSNLTDSTTPGATGNASATHTHNVTGSSTLGVTEGTTASGVTIAFDGADQTAALGGPFNADAIELNVLPYLATAKSVFHVIAMQPTSLGRIEAHLRLGVYVAAGSVF